MTKHSAMLRIWEGGPVPIVAELSANHGQDYGAAIALIKAAKDAGADAIKIQTYTPDTITLDSRRECFQVRGGSLWDGRSLYDLYREAYTPWEWQAGLQKKSHELGMDFFSSAFDPTSVDFLEGLNVPVHKIASFELVDIPLIRKAAATGKPLILSTGMATIAEIDEAISAAREAGAQRIALLKCTSAYPALPEEMNLCTIPHLKHAFGVQVGLSDHSMGIEVPVAAVALGARMIEKHFILSRAAGGPDSAFSLEPSEFQHMVAAVRRAESALGRVFYGPGKRENVSLSHRRSLFAVRDIAAGETFTAENLRSVRPADGLHTRNLGALIGRKASAAIEHGTPLEWWHVADPAPGAK